MEIPSAIAFLILFSCSRRLINNFNASQKLFPVNISQGAVLNIDLENFSSNYLCGKKFIESIYLFHNILCCENKIRPPNNLIYQIYEYLSKGWLENVT
jgi:hypothetical protein